MKSPPRHDLIPLFCVNNEVLSHLHPDFPHVLCLTEYHLKYSQLNNVHIENYNLGAYYCRQLCEKGGVAILSIIVYVSQILILLNTVKNKI